MIYFVQHQVAAARRSIEEGLALFREVSDPWGIARALNMLGEISLAAGDADAAQELMTEAMRVTRIRGPARRNSACPRWAMPRSFNATCHQRVAGTSNA